MLTGWTQIAWGYLLSFLDYPSELCAVPSGWPTNFAPIALRTEMIFVNGTPLTQVTTYADLRPGTFFVQRQLPVVHIDPPTGTNMSDRGGRSGNAPQTLSVGKPQQRRSARPGFRPCRQLHQYERGGHQLAAPTS